MNSHQRTLIALILSQVAILLLGAFPPPNAYAWIKWAFAVIPGIVIVLCIWLVIADVRRVVAKHAVLGVIAQVNERRKNGVTK